MSKINGSSSDIDIHLIRAQNSLYLERITRLAFLVPSHREGPSNPGNYMGVPPIFWGESGVGKSERIMDTAAAMDFSIHTVFGSSIEPPDIGGALVAGNVDTENPTVKRVPALPQVQYAISDVESVLFLDELADSPLGVQKSIQGAILSRRFGTEKLPSQVRIVAAANDTDQGGMFVLSPPLANRFMHIDVAKTSVDKWASHNFGELKPFEALEKREAMELVVLENWVPLYRGAITIISQYLQRNTTDFHLRPQDPLLAGKAWQSPRTWSMAARIMATGSAIGESPTVIDLAVGGAVGSSAASNLRQYVKSLGLPSYDDVVQGRWTPTIQHMDAAYITYSMVTQHLKEQRAKSEAISPDEIEAVWVALEQADKAGVLDMAMIVQSQLIELKNASPTARTKKISSELYARSSKFSTKQRWT